MKIQIKDLTGPALDYAVAKALEWTDYPGDSIEAGDTWHMDPKRTPFGPIVRKKDWAPSTDWRQGGPIIECEIGNLWKHNKVDPSEPDVWTAAAYLKAQEGTMLYYEDGPTPLIAAMRCYVASKLGDEVEIPDELIQK
jgi:hypothetical protein